MIIISNNQEIIKLISQKQKIIIEGICILYNLNLKIKFYSI